MADEQQVQAPAVPPPTYSGQEEPKQETINDVLMLELESANRNRLWLLAQRVDFLRRMNELERENAALKEQVAALMPPEPEAQPQEDKPEQVDQVQFQDGCIEEHDIAKPTCEMAPAVPEPVPA